VPSGAWRQRRAAAVVKLLALAPSHRLHREQVIEALWPELDGEAAANNLRVAMHRARSRLEEAGAPRGRFLVRDGEDVALAAADAVWIDVDAYEAALARAWLTEDPAVSREALDHYAGDLLPEDLYEDWAANRRAELRASYLTLLARLAQLHEQRGELGRAIATLQRLLVAEPLDEPAHLVLIRLFARAGETRQAVTQYERLTELLERELGTEPDEKTRELIAAIREGTFPAEAESFAPLAPEQSDISPGPPTADRLVGLPAPMEGLIGRDREIAEVRRLLAGRRLVTLTGPAGVGKTSLALAVAHALAGELKQGVRFVELASLRDPELVLPAIARAFGIRDEVAGSAPVESLADQLGGRSVLLVLDNFEQITAASPQVAELLAACPGLTVLVTSRGRLRLHGEQEYPVQPLAVPESEVGSRKSEGVRAKGVSPSVALADMPAVALFVRRAGEADPGFAIDESNAQAVAAICQRLDGLPLAIELAAARVRILPPEALLNRLELAKPLTVLTGGPRDAPARQQTLRAAIAWSHDLLTAEEQRLYRRLAVFAGGFSLEAADEVERRESGVGSAVQDASSSALRPPSSVFELVASLVEQSLLRRLTGVNGESRFGMLETIREYALEQLAESGEEDLIRARHAAFFMDLAQRAAPELNGPAAARWLADLEHEHDNLRAALASLAAQGRTADRLRLAGVLWRFWWLHGHLSEGRAHLERALADGNESPAEVRARALGGAASLAAAQGDLDHADALHAEALRRWREAGDRVGMATALTNLGLVADERGDPQQAAAYLQEALAIARTTGDRRGIAVALANLGQVAMTLQEHQRAAALLGESMALFRELGDERSQAAILANLGMLAFLIGDFTRAQICHEEALGLLRGLGDRQGEADELLNLGHTVQRLGDLERAGTLFAEALDRFAELGDRSGVAFAQNHLGRLAHIHGNDADAEKLLEQGLALGQEIGDRVAVAESLEGLAVVACARGDAARGARLIGAAEALREATGVPLPDVHRAEYQQVLGEALRILGAGAFAAARAEGQQLALDESGDPRLGLPARVNGDA
jgi:predicted ATPase/DNA-binding SARP family transcriptional activator